MHHRWGHTSASLSVHTWCGLEPRISHMVRKTLHWVSYLLALGAFEQEFMSPILKSCPRALLAQFLLTKWSGNCTPFCMSFNTKVGGGAKGAQKVRLSALTNKKAWFL